MGYIKEFKDLYESLFKIKDPVTKIILIVILLLIAFFFIRTAYMVFKSTQPSAESVEKDTLAKSTMPLKTIKNEVAKEPEAHIEPSKLLAKNKKEMKTEAKFHVKDNTFNEPTQIGDNNVQNINQVPTITSELKLTIISKIKEFEEQNGKPNSQIGVGVFSGTNTGKLQGQILDFLRLSGYRCYPSTIISENNVKRILILNNEPLPNEINIILGNIE